MPVVGRAVKFSFFHGIKGPRTMAYFLFHGWWDGGGYGHISPDIIATPTLFSGITYFHG